MKIQKKKSYYKDYSKCPKIQLQNTLLSWFKIKLANAEEELHTSQISIATTTSIMKQTWLINEYHQLINGNIKPITSRPSRCEVAKHLITNSSK